MGKVRVESFTVSLDGYGAGLEQTRDAPMGVGGERLHGWAFGTPTFQRMVFGQEGGTDGVDEGFAKRGFRDIGAWILGRNMFGPVRGPWPDLSWRGWWGENPPYHVPIYVLTHHPRPKLEMEGDNVFHFVEGLEQALTLAREAAGARDVRIGGGVQTVRGYLAMGAIDEMHLAISPVLLGRGEALLAGLDLPGLGYRVAEVVAGEGATHVVIARA